MGKGFLRLQVVAAEGAILIDHATITITDENNNVLHVQTTDSSGHIPEISLDAPDISLTEDPLTTQRRYSMYNASVSAAGYRHTVYRGVMIFDQSTSIQVINVRPLSRSDVQSTETLEIGGHALDEPVMPEPQDRAPDLKVLKEVIIPNFIIVHLGRPENYAPNVRVPFIDYIKNVASHEIFDT
ncbi:MAG: hypothetical protein FWD98_08720, partial [Defluviitaleaceae bacterium]|nr:hypothetical protein [Defluviitaleaceae bacterium]